MSTMHGNKGCVMEIVERIVILPLVLLILFIAHRIAMALGGRAGQFLTEMGILQ